MLCVVVRDAPWAGGVAALEDIVPGGIAQS